jgi:CRP/FNR family transcriptional regulator, cyclic AMP receptor protein
MTTIRGVFSAADEFREIPAGAVVFSEGAEGHEMFGVVSGLIELRKGQTPVARIGIDGTFGELALIDHSVRSLTALAIEPSRVAVINERTFLYLVHETPSFALQVMRSMAERLRQLDPPSPPQG